MLRTFSEMHLVGTVFSIGPLLMKKILNGGAHQTITTMGSPGNGIGDIGLKKHMILHLIMRVWSRIWLQIGWPLD